MQRVERISPGGIFLGKDLAFNFDTPLMHSFVGRMCRGLLRAEFGIEYFTGDIEWRLNIDLEDIIYQAMAKFGRMRIIHDVFAYQVTEPKDKEPGWAIMNFYQRLEIFARIARREPVRASVDSPVAST
jgi:hypothetical protein